MTIHLVGTAEGDWVGLYVNGELKVEDHSLSPHDVLKALGLRFTEKEVEELPTGSLPQHYKDLQ